MDIEPFYDTFSTKRFVAVLAAGDKTSTTPSLFNFYELGVAEPFKTRALSLTYGFFFLNFKFI